MNWINEVIFQDKEWVDYFLKNLILKKNDNNDIKAQDWERVIEFLINERKNNQENVKRPKTR